jgi:hypothetical protein
VESWLVQLKESPQAILRSNATLWTTKELMTKYQDRDLNTHTKLGANTLGKKLRVAGFNQWGCGQFGGQGRVIKKLSDRLWIVPSKPSDATDLQKVPHADIYDLYRSQHSQKFAGPSTNASP